MHPSGCDPLRFRRERGHPLILGHRGLPGDERENRLASFRWALEAGADGVELDIQLSLDGIPVVSHDACLQRTHGSARKVAQLDASQLEELGVSRLETVLSTLCTSAMLNLDLKDFFPWSRGWAGALVDLVTHYQAHGRVLFSSFNPLAWSRVRRRDARLYVAQLCGPRWLGSLGQLWRPPAIHPHASLLTPERVSSWRLRGQRIVVWGANRDDQLRQALDLEVDGIITDRLEAAVRLRAAG